MEVRPDLQEKKISGTFVGRGENSQMDV